MGAPFSVDSNLLLHSLLGPLPPLVLDVRRSDIRDGSGRMLPQAKIADHGDGPSLARILDRSRPVIVACAHGHNRSQRLAAFLRSEGFAASVLEGGYDGWEGAGLPLVRLEARGLKLGAGPTAWVTRPRPKIDRIACPWLIRRFLDPSARILFVGEDWAMEIASQENAASLDMAGATFSHEGDLCSFDILIREFGLADFAPLARLALIIRAADTNRLDLAPEAAGLVAISAGLSARHADADHALLAAGFTLYDGLLSWAMRVTAQADEQSEPQRKTA